MIQPAAAKQSSRTPSILPLHIRVIALIASVVALVLAARICVRSRNEFVFEDAYMFFRYAVQLRHGYGIAWNPGGPHTFGLTSLPWLLFVWCGTFFSSIPDHVLPTLSVLVGMFALALLAVLFSRRAQSPWLSHPEITFPLIALPLLLNHNFDTSLTNGMETMLGFLLVVVFLDGTLRLLQHPSVARSLLLALLAFLAVLTRPEALLPLAVTPLCATPLLPRGRRLVLLATFFATLSVLLAADLLFNRAYFGTPVPLAFYIKAVHGYNDYLWLLNPFAANLSFLAIASPSVLAIVLFARRAQARLLVLFLLPVTILCLYLLSVMQIMGTGARYYTPFLPFLLFPALLLIDGALTPADTGSAFAAPLSLGRLAAVVLTLLLTNAQYAEHFSGPLGTLLASHHHVWDPPRFAITSDQPLQSPHDPWPSYHAVARIAAHLPPGSSLALTEVGDVGAASPQVNLLDMAGLNNVFLARHHFDMNYIFGEQPDLIWLPHTDYTRSYGIFCTDPRLLRDYTVYADAFLFGVAIRKQSPFHDQVVAAVAPEFARLYPGVDMSRYQVRSVAWNPRSTHTIDSLHTIEP